MKAWFSRLVARWTRRLHHRRMQTERLSRKTLALFFFLVGATLVSLVSLAFAKMADFAIEQNAKWIHAYPLAAFVITPLGLMLSVWLMRRFAPYTSGSGIPQVIASLTLPAGAAKTRLIVLGETLLKIPLTFLGMLAGASIGREGPSVQVGAAVMHAWGAWCKKHNLSFRNFQENDLIAAGAAGGLAAAFNAPLAGVIFAIEELGRGVLLRWERHILIGVLASGFILIAIAGNNPYFPHFEGAPFARDMAAWVLLCGLVSGVGGGIFARLLSKGLASNIPARFRGFVRRRPIVTAGILGLAVALIGTLYGGQTFGAGYEIGAIGLAGQAQDFPLTLAPAKLLATVLSYWAGIPGGIFTPALTTGASLGVTLWQLTGGSVAMDVLVLLSMAAFLAAATQSPLTSSVIVMEMTGSQPMLFWLLIACIFASVVSRQFCPRPFYHFAAGRFHQSVREELAGHLSEKKESSHGSESNRKNS